LEYLWMHTIWFMKDFGIFIGCLLISYVFLDVGRLISIYTIVTLLSLNVLRESLAKSEIQGDLRFNKRQPLGEVFQKNFN
jgi:hypothetical protein